MRYTSAYGHKGKTMSLLRLTQTTFIFFLFLTFSTAQPVTWTYVPGEFGDGDTITLLCEWGTIDQQVSPTISATLTHSYSEFDIDSASQISLDVSNSWMCDDGKCETSVSVDHAQRKIHFSIIRTDNVPKGGYGTWATGPGIGIEIEEMSRLASPTLQTIKIYPNPAAEYFFVEPLSQAEIQSAVLLDLTGKQLQYALGNYVQKKWDLSTLPSGIYFLQVRTSQGVQTKKIWKRQ